MSLASEARDAVRKRPILYDALRTGVVNYRAAADRLDLDGDPEAVATALRRFAAELDPLTTRSVETPVRMQSGVSLVEEEAVDIDPDDLVVAVGGKRVVRGGEMTAIRASGGVDASACRHVLACLETASVVVDSVGAVAGDLVVVVPRRQGATALRVVEDALSSVPTAE
ncbi:hypothetical protein C2R22_07185 [Salinigranum rubrum]|uniref:Uncharacterized protein n=1 Tax=Salinigranum rubrum TaxID=755307 RepID=A0A2I8VHR0_9EURY|nr:hypothetical protein [Salinigranum rubrum]AUV81466.1 hypothetical protein C2R22_07185 [Salinigranum rubrum]